MLQKLPRWQVLNNPGNIRHSKDRWSGMAPDQPDSAFVKFIAKEWGVRAIARLMITYEKLGFNTPRKIIARYAPPSENDTDDYVELVAQALNVAQDEEIDVDVYQTMKTLVGIICLKETGKRQPDGVIKKGLELAGVHGAPTPGMMSKGLITKGVAGGATVLTLAGNAAEPVKKAAEGLEPFQGSPLIAQVTIGLLTVAGAATLASIAADWLKARKGL